MLLPLSGLCKEKIRPFAQIRTEMKNFVMHPSCNFRPVQVRVVIGQARSPTKLCVS